MSQRVDRNIQRQLLSVLRADSLAIVASIVGTKGAAQTILAHYRHKVALIKQAFQLNIARFIQAANPIDVVKRTINQMIVWNWFYLFIREYAVEFATPCSREIRIGATTRRKKESAVAKINSQIFQLGFRQHEIVMAVHEQERRLVQVGIG